MHRPSRRILHVWGGCAHRRAGNRSSTLALPAFFAILAVLVGAIAGVRTFRSPAASALAAFPAADETSVLTASTGALRLFRFRAAPKIVVAIFPSLHAQAMALNRVAAFIERPGVPHDRLLDDSQLGAAMGRTPEAFDAYYYGHDYRAADLARFYATADRDGVGLNGFERDLRRRLTAGGFFRTLMPGALISLPQPGSFSLDAVARATILHHELAHGAYFTDAAYAAYVTAFWTGLTVPERAAFRRFLAADGYDTGNDDLMRNETQAYLVFTADPRMFDPAGIGLPEVLALRHAFLASLPAFWLGRDAAPD